MHSNSRLRYVQFINQLIGIPERKTASGLRSDTQGVEEYRMNTSKGQFVFADTPGFDDTHRSDQDILRIIAAWLEDKYESPPCIFHD